MLVPAPAAGQAQTPRRQASARLVGDEVVVPVIDRAEELVDEVLALWLADVLGHAMSQAAPVRPRLPHHARRLRQRQGDGPGRAPGQRL